MPNSVLRRVYSGFSKGGEARRGALVLSTILGLAAGGCSMSFPMASLLPEEEPAATGSIAAKPASPLSPKLGVEDWRRAKAALAVALDPQGNGAPASWDNPDSGAKGSFAPAGKPFVRNDDICRAFRASLAGRDLAASLQGTACRPSGGEWAVKDVKPARRPG